MRIRTQVILITLMPLGLILGINYYQSLKFEQLLNLKLESQINATKKRLIYNLETNISQTKKIAHLLAKNYEIAEAINNRDNDLLYVKARFYIDSKLISNVVFIDKEKMVLSRGNDEYRFNDSKKQFIKKILNKKENPFTGLIKFDDKYQLATITPVYKYDVVFVGYLIVSHIIDEVFFSSIIENNEYLEFRVDDYAIDNFNDNTLDNIELYSSIKINIPTKIQKGLNKPRFIVYKDFTKEKQFIEKSRYEQNIIIILMLTLFPSMIVFFIKRKLDPLNNLDTLLSRFYEDEISLKTLIKYLNDLPKGHNELAKIINSIVITLETLDNTQENLISSKAEAQNANRVKTDFLSNMSHEIKTPLNTIIAYSNKLLSSELNGIQKNQMKNIKQSAEALISIVNDVIALSRIESDKLRFNKSYIPVSNIFNDIKNLFHISLLEKNLKYIYIPHKDTDKYLFEVDEIRLKQIIINLFGNSIKFTKKGFIKLIFDFVKTSKNTANIVISIEDTGFGISDRNLLKIYNCFTSKKTEDNLYNNMGLGLSVTKRLIDLMDGEIKIDSKKGKGTIITIYLNDVYIKKTKKESKNQDRQLVLKEDLKESNLIKLLEYICSDDNLIEELNEAIERFDELDSIKPLEHLMNKISLENNSKSIRNIAEQIKDKIDFYGEEEKKDLVYKIKECLVLTE